MGTLAELGATSAATEWVRVLWGLQVAASKPTEWMRQELQPRFRQQLGEDSPGISLHSEYSAGALPRAASDLDRFDNAHCIQGKRQSSGLSNFEITG